MWILLTDKLPTGPSPPKLSIFWSIPWPDEPRVKMLRKRLLKTKRSLFGTLSYIYESDLVDADEWEGARKIRYKNSEIRVFPHEFNLVETKFIEEMVNGGAHALVPESVAEEAMIHKVLKKGQREIYEAALIDGCTEAQAMATALGQDVTLPNWKFPPIGWYRPAEKYAKFFCYPKEMRG